jgi:hypothetical protein
MHPMTGIVECRQTPKPGTQCHDVDIKCIADASGGKDPVVAVPSPTRQPIQRLFALGATFLNHPQRVDEQRNG